MSPSRADGKWLMAKGQRRFAICHLPSAICHAALVLLFSITATAADLPELTAPVNDSAHVIDAQDATAIDRMSRALKAASGDVVVVVTVPGVAPFADINEYANKLFENHGRGIGDKGKDNGVLIVLAVNDRKVRIEVGYALEQWITDGFAGETIRQLMIPLFREGRYGAGLRAGTARIASRIAQGRNVRLEDGQIPDEQPSGDGTPIAFAVIVLVFLAILIVSRIGSGPRRGVSRWGRGPWSGWSSGVGSFGGFGGGGSGGGGFGGGFGGFGGGSSGGGGASGSW